MQVQQLTCWQQVHTMFNGSSGKGTLAETHNKNSPEGQKRTNSNTETDNVIALDVCGR